MPPSVLAKEEATGFLRSICSGVTWKWIERWGGIHANPIGWDRKRLPVDA